MLSIPAAPLDIDTDILWSHSLSIPKSQGIKRGGTSVCLPEFLITSRFAGFFHLSPFSFHRYLASVDKFQTTSYSFHIISKRIRKTEDAHLRRSPTGMDFFKTFDGSGFCSCSIRQPPESHHSIVLFLLHFLWIWLGTWHLIRQTRTRVVVHPPPPSIASRRAPVCTRAAITVSIILARSAFKHPFFFRFLNDL